ncbi:SET domain-containing protein [Ophiobolus disseminans]|uniref:SET domain-containing protein n=1 Tax=Ophiobolus disseminans TaxID=1469910 RepID=A0A6A7AET9_9PLEO|nr:SET domain-containing protein [Ophiobolus disseminans]
MKALSASTITSAVNFYFSKSTNAKGEAIGNGFFAGCDLGAGAEIVSLKRPLVGSLDTQHLQDVCANCYVWTEGASSGARLYVSEGTKVQKCAGCQRFRYCSKICQKEAWNRGHKHECKSLRSLTGRGLPKAVLACMELLTRRKHGLIPDDEWATLCELQTHIDDFKKNGAYENIELMAMGASQFSLTQNMFNKDFVAAMYARVLTNSMTLITPTLDPLGLILDPTLGNINHSCDPNAFVMMYGSAISLRTLRPIKKDEEVYISYVDITNPYHQRQQELEARWFFKCTCTKCQKGATLDEDKWIREPRTMPKKVKDVADAIIKHANLAQDPANYIGDSLDEQRTSVIQAKAFAEYEEVQNMQGPQERIEKIEGAMQLCHQSGLWPVYRQPYASLRDDLIVNLLGVGKYQLAWAQCAKRYKYILPKLYPVPFHPIRVVQTWQMAVLAVYLAGDPDGAGVPCINMGLIAMMLVKQVLDASKLSHGANSAFAKSVQRKAEEMMDELNRNLDGNPDKEVMDRELEVQRDMLMEMGDWIKV